MLRRFLALLSLAFLLAPFSARAQVVSLYLQSTNVHLSNVQTGVIYPAGSTSYVNQFTSNFTSGVGGGLTLNVIPVGPVRFGFDLRGSTNRGTPGVDTGMFGVRVAFKPPLVPIKPYLQASGGYMQSRTTNVSTSVSGVASASSTFTNRYATYEFFGGVDISILPLLDLRLEAGGGQGINVTDIGNVNVSNNVTLFSVNPGLVLRF